MGQIFVISETTGGNPNYIGEVAGLLHYTLMCPGEGPGSDAAGTLSRTALQPDGQKGCCLLDVASLTTLRLPVG